MRLGDAVRVRIPGARSLKRGVITALPSAGSVTVKFGFRSDIFPRSQVTVIRKKREAEVVIANIRGLKNQVDALVRDRGNKQVAR